MKYIELFKADSSTFATSAPLTSYYSLNFDEQSDFKTSTLQFSMPAYVADAAGIFAGAALRVMVDGKLLDNTFLVVGRGYDFVTEDGVYSRQYNASSAHSIFEDDVVLPSAWPNPVPTGHSFQNASPGNIIKTLITRSQQRGFMTMIDHSSFSGTTDSNGAAWPSMMDRSYNSGDTLLSVMQGLVDAGLVELKMVGNSLKAYKPGTLSKTIPGSTFTLRAAQNLSEGSTEEDASEFATDIYAIGEGDAVTSKTRPSSYNTIGRRRARFANYGGIADKALLGVMADAELEQYSKVRREDSLAVAHEVVNPFFDYNVGDWVAIYRGGSNYDTNQIKQISVQVDNSGSISVSLAVGDLLDSAEVKLKRRLDAITGGNAGGGAVPSDKNNDRMPPAPPTSITTSSISYVAPDQTRKVAGLVDWPDVTTNADGSVATDISQYEIKYRTSTTKNSGTPQTLSPGRSYNTLNSLFDRRTKPFGWVGGDGVDSTRASNGKDYWFFGDSAVGYLDSTGRPVKGKPYSYVNNAVVQTDPADVGVFNTYVGRPNIIEDGNARSFKSYFGTETNSINTVTTEWSPFGGTSYKFVPKTAGAASVTLGLNFFGNKGVKPLTGGAKYTVMGTLRKSSTPRTFNIGVACYDNSGNFLGNATQSVTESSTQDVSFSIVVTTLPSTTQGCPTYGLTSAVAGEAHFHGKWGLFEGDARSQTWNYNASYDALLKPYAMAGASNEPNSTFVSNLLDSAYRKSGEVRTVWLGDSISEGVGASAWSKRTITLLQDKLRTTYKKTSKAVGYVPAAWAGWTQAATTLSSTGVTTDFNSYGLGARCVKLTNGGSVTYQSLYASEIDVYYTATDFFPSTFDVYVDNVKIDSVNTYNASAVGGRAVYNRYSVTPGNHVVKLVGTGGNDAVVHGVEFRDGDSAAYLIDGAHTGWNADLLTNPPTGYFDALRAARPQHVSILLGANDMAANTADQFESKLEQAISRVQTELTSPGEWPIPITFYLWTELPDQPATSGNPQALALYEAAAAQACSKFMNVEFIPLGRFFPSGRTGNASPKWADDGIHPNDTGCTMLSDAIMSRLTDPLKSNLIWLGAGWSAGGKVYATGMQITTDWGKEQSILAQWDADTMVLEKFGTLPCPDPSIQNQWSNAVWVEGTYVYIFGQNANSNPVLMRTSATDPFNTALDQVWNGTAWTGAAGASAAQIANPGKDAAFSSIRKFGSTYEGYFMLGLDANIYKATASALTGPWTVQSTPVYKCPEYGNGLHSYIPRMHSQFDSSGGLVYGYSTNDYNATFGDAVPGPRFVVGPAASLVPVDLSATEYGAIQTVEESKAYYSGFEPNTALQVMVRTIDSSGLASTWKESTPAVLTGSAGETLVTPSTPRVSAMFQGLRATWDGLDIKGNRPTKEWAGVEVHVSDKGADFVPTGTTRMDLLPIIESGGGGVSPVPGLKAATTYWVRFVALGKDGSTSPASSSVSVTTEQLIGNDLAPKLVDAAKLGDGVVNTANLNVATFSEQIIPNADFEDGFDFNVPKRWTSTNMYSGDGDTQPALAPKPISGTASWQHTVKPGSGRTWRSDIVALVPGDVYYFSAKVATSRKLATDNSISVGVAYSQTSDPASFEKTTNQNGIKWIDGELVSDGNGSKYYLPFKGSASFTSPSVLEGQVVVPQGMNFGCILLKCDPDDGAATSVVVKFDDIQFKRVVGTANIANSAINKAQIADLAVDSAKIAEVSAGKISVGSLLADITVSARIKTANKGNRVELNANGLQAYAGSSSSPVTEVRTDGGLVSQWFRTNTTGTRIEAGTYAQGGDSALFAFFPDSRVWHFPPAVGYGGQLQGAYYPGIAMHSGSLTTTDYATYGLSMIGLDQKSGINLITGNKLDATESTTGANINIDAGGGSSKVLIRGGGSDRAQLSLDSAYWKSYLSLPGGQLNFGSTTGQATKLAVSDIDYAGRPKYHMYMHAFYGFRLVTRAGSVDINALNINSYGIISGDSSSASSPKIGTRDTETYWIQWDNNGTAYRGQNAGSAVQIKTFVIDHPTDEDRYLVHATNEMPEARVEYTGNSRLVPADPVYGPQGVVLGQQLQGDNSVEIVLPDYFCDLVDESTAVVLVTPYYDAHECEYKSAPSLAATKVKDGKFSVKAVGGIYHPDVEFAWRVSAVRKDVPQFEVEPLKSSGTKQGNGPYTYFEKESQ